MFVVTINVTTREISELNPSDVRKVQLVESKGEGKSPEAAFAAAYRDSGLSEYVEAMDGGARIISAEAGKFGGQGS